MADNTVTVEEIRKNIVNTQDIINAVTVSANDPNVVTVVAATFIDDAGVSSNLLYASGPPSSAVGTEGDFYIDVQLGNLYGPKADEWPSDPLALIPKRNVFIQEAASSVWSINHSLGGFPSVTVVDSAGTVVIGEVTYNSTSSISVAFRSAFSGKAYLT